MQMAPWQWTSAFSSHLRAYVEHLPGCSDWPRWSRSASPIVGVLHQQVAGRGRLAAPSTYQSATRGQGTRASMPSPLWLGLAGRGAISHSAARASRGVPAAAPTPGRQAAELRYVHCLLQLAAVKLEQPDVVDLTGGNASARKRSSPSRRVTRVPGVPPGTGRWFHVSGGGGPKKPSVQGQRRCRRDSRARSGFIGGRKPALGGPGTNKLPFHGRAASTAANDLIARTVGVHVGMSQGSARPRLNRSSWLKRRGLVVSLPNSAYDARADTCNPLLPSSDLFHQSRSKSPT